MPLWRTVAFLLMLPDRNELLARWADAKAVAAATLHGAWIFQPIECHQEAAGRAGCAARGTGITVRGVRQRTWAAPETDMKTGPQAAHFGSDSPQNHCRTVTCADPTAATSRYHVYRRSPGQIRL